MTSKKKHIRDLDSEELSKELLLHSNIRFEKEKEDVWAAMESVIGNESEHSEKSSFSFTRILSLAAIFIILISSGAFLRYYSKSYHPLNDALSITLPDDSKIWLEENSIVKYYPLWWKIQRNITLKGTAEFEVEKGRPFKVKSTKGITEVLGTRFRIESSLEKYAVACFSGSVKVSDRSSAVSAVIIANEKAEITGTGKFKVTLIPRQEKDVVIENGYITFKNQAIQEVFKECESRFGVKIEVSQELDLHYTGNIKAGGDITDILRAICLPMELEYVQLSPTKYLIQPNNSD
jgi:transmembrane sensor